MNTNEDSLGTLKCLTLIQITGKPLQKNVRAYILFLHPKATQHGVMGLATQGGHQNSIQQKKFGFLGHVFKMKSGP